MKSEQRLPSYTGVKLVGVVKEWDEEEIKVGAVSPVAGAFWDQQFSSEDARQQACQVACLVTMYARPLIVIG